MFRKINRFIFSLVEGIKLAMYAIWTNKMRSSLTMFGIIIGIVMVTSMVTIIDGINRSFQSSMSMIGDNVLFIQKWPWGMGAEEYRWWEYRNRREMDVSYASLLEQRSRFATAVSAEAFARRNIQFEDREARQIQIQGVTTSYQVTSAINVERGRFFTDEENQTRRRVMVLGYDVAEALFQNRDPIGRTVRMGGQRYEVIGVLEQQGSFLGLESFDELVVIPLLSFGQQFGLRGNINIRVKFDSEEDLYEGQYEIEGLMRSIRRLDPTDDNDFAINKMEMFEQQYRAMTGAIYGIGIFLTGLSLFVGGIGVMNIMYVSVKERTREVGIRKAVGARYSEILMQFLIEAIVICGIGGVMGIGLSMVIVVLINQFFVAYMSLQTVILAFTICTMTGVLFGFLPAHKAAKADPISSLRYS